MIEPFNSEFLAPGKKYRRLSVLLSIHDNAQISQHKMAELTHLSSSMVNNYIKELQEDGLISVTGETNRTLRYYLTTRGRNELMTSLLLYSSEIIQLYTGAKQEVAERLHGMHKEGIRTVVLFGAAETAEVVLAAMKQIPLKAKGVVDSDPEKQGKKFNGLTVESPEKLRHMTADAVLITSFGRQEEIHGFVLELVGYGMKVVKLSDL